MNCSRSDRSLLGLVLTLLAGLAGLVGTAGAQTDPHAHAAPPATNTPRAPWSERTLELFARLPVQEGGRVKPLDTYAQFRLLRLNGKRKLITTDGEKLGPTAWLLDCFFFPERARTYRAFLVRDQAVLEAVGVRVEGRKKNDRYSYAELVAGREKLFSEASRVHAIESKNRNGLESQIYALALNLRDFEDLTHALDFARADLPTYATEALRAVYGSEPQPGVAHFLNGLPKLMAELEARGESLTTEQREAERQALMGLNDELDSAGRSSSALAVYPPVDLSQEEWHFTIGALEEAYAGKPEPAQLIAGWEALMRTRDDPAAFEAELEQLHARTSAMAERRGEYSKVPLEVSFYRWDFFTRALVAFLGSFVLLCASWLLPRARWLAKGVGGLSLLATVLVVAGVTMRCVLRERPPVSTLYETILFITGSCAIVLLVVEWIQRKGIALALTPVLGAAGMFLSMKYELKEAALAGDTMPSLVAVLDTNFWLATHVTTITLGYAAGLLAAALGNLWMLGKMVGFKRGDADFYRTISRMTYGVVCFGLIFSVVGTILGGVWANYSWGRFWGWDPKENGALLICIAQLLTLHARMGGYIREHGIAALSALNGLVVAFSWWHVNNLGVGLHSYGKTEGVLLALYTYYGIGLLIVLGSFLWRLGTQHGGTQPPQASTS
jgi:ABC-type transport system involved in cytochrome c biogenesis permease subunit